MWLHYMKLDVKLPFDPVCRSVRPSVRQFPIKVGSHTFVLLSFHQLKRGQQLCRKLFYALAFYIISVVVDDN